MTSNSAAEDWTKFVTLNPPNEVRFKMSEDDKNSDKAFAKITIINKSKSAILFKVSIFDNLILFSGQNNKYKKLYG
jgi:hypothetical protein